MMSSKSFEKPEQGLRQLCQVGKSGMDGLNKNFPHRKALTSSNSDGKYVCVKYAGEIASDC